MTKNSQKGFALVTALLVLLMMTIMGIAMVNRSTLNTNMSLEYDRSSHVLFAAEAGIEHARRYLENQTSQNLYPTNSLGPLTAVPGNNCLADYQDGIGGAGAGQFNTLSKDAGQYAFRFPPSQSSDTLNMNTSCSNENASQNTNPNFRRMDCELDLANDSTISNAEINFFKTFGFSYYIFEEGQESSSAATSSAGTGEIGSSQSYSGSKTQTTYYYRVISCGAQVDWNGTAATGSLKQLNTVEARIKLTK